MKHVILWGLVIVGLALAIWFWFKPVAVIEGVMDKRREKESVEKPVDYYEPTDSNIKG